MIAQAPAVMGRTYPRIATAPLVKGEPGPCGCGCALSPATSYGFDVEDFARDVLNRPLDPWQRHLVIHAGELLGEEGNGGLSSLRRPRFRQVLVLVARQRPNGKTELLVILTLYWLYVDRVRLVLGTSTNLDTARESWEKAVSLAEDNPTLASEVGDVRRTNGEQTLTTVWGGRYKIAASNRKGGRGLTIDRLVLDELREHAHWDSYNAAVPAMNAVPDATAFFISNQGDDKSQVLNALRDQALEGSDERLGLFEWSSEDGMDPTDPEALAMANPSLGRRIFLDTLMGDAIRAKQAGGEQLADFLTEVHCRRVPLLNPAIDLDAWSRSYSAENSLEAFKDKLALCVDVSFDQTHATLYAAAVDGERVRVDPVAAWEGQDAISQMSSQLPALVEKMKPRVLGWFPDGPAAAALPALTPRQGWPPAGVTVEAIRQVTAVCMGFAEQVRSDKVYHSGDPLLDAHVRAAEKLSYGDGWRFTRRKAGHVDAAYAAAGAVHLARTLQDESEPMIF